MAEIMEGIHPTRMELLEINDKIVLAEKGHKLLKEKRDSLMTEFFEMVNKAKGSRDELLDSMQKGYNELIKAEALMTSSSVESIACATPGSRKVDIGIRNIMGVKIPKMKLVSLSEMDSGWSYTMMSTSSKLDDAVRNFNVTVEGIVKFVELEESIRRLGDEIKKTRRRVNSLEYIMIPKLRNTRQYIRMRLEEMEREGFFRMKMIKKKKAKAVS